MNKILILIFSPIFLFSQPIIEIGDNNNDSSKQVFYESLLSNLNQNNLLLQTASLKEDQLDVSISTSQHRNAIRSSSYAASIVQSVSKKQKLDVNQINITIYLQVCRS